MNVAARVLEMGESNPNPSAQLLFQIFRFGSNCFGIRTGLTISDRNWPECWWVYGTIHEPFRKIPPEFGWKKKQSRIGVTGQCPLFYSIFAIKDQWSTHISPGILEPLVCLAKERDRRLYHFIPGNFRFGLDSCFCFHTVWVELVHQMGTAW